MSAAVRFGSAVKELRIHLCQKGAASKGVRYVKFMSSMDKVT